MTSSANIQRTKSPKTPVTTYYEEKIGKCLFRVTSVHMGKIELGKALEELAVKKILALENQPPLFAEP